MGTNLQIVVENDSAGKTGRQIPFVQERYHLRQTPGLEPDPFRCRGGDKEEATDNNLSIAFLVI